MRLFSNLFKSKIDVWRPFAQEFGGKYIEGGFLRSARIEFSNAVPIGEAKHSTGQSLGGFRSGVTTLTTKHDTEANSWATCFVSPIDVPSDLMISVMKNWPYQKLIERVGSFVGVKTSSLGEDEGTLLTNDDKTANKLLTLPDVRQAIVDMRQFTLSIGTTPRLSLKKTVSEPELTLLLPYIVNNKFQLLRCLEFHRLIADSVVDLALPRSEPEC